MKDNNKPLIEFENFNLKVFLSKIDLLKNTNNYKIKGPYIYCAVVRNLKFLNNANNQIIREMGANAAESLFPLNFYHAGIFECTKKLIIHYGEEDENNKKKPLSIESKNEEEIAEYQVYKYFYSKKAPETFINLIDKNDWTSERYSILNHNCIHCTNEYLILNNITPIAFGPFKKPKNIAYPYLCDKCLNDLGRSKMYLKLEKKFNFLRAFFNLTSDTPETYNHEFTEEELMEYSYRCKKCFDNFAEWEYNNSWLKKSEEENEKFLIFENEFDGNIVNNINKHGESLDDLLIKVKIKNLPNYQYGLIRKDLIEETGKNYGFVALASLNENKIIEYGNEKYNNGDPVLRDINLEDKILYHTVRIFKLNVNINELFNSINLIPWTSNRYDVFYYNSYNFINIYLNKYNQKLFLIKNAKIFNNAFLHLCRDCYKKLNHPNCYVGPDLSHVHNHLCNDIKKKEDKFWWCWDCGKKNATFHFIGEPFNRNFLYLCRKCYYDLAEPKNYIKLIDNKYRMDPFIGGLIGILNPNLAFRNELCRKCAKYNADYKLIRPNY